jgi:uncharacterized phage protein (TIGR02218 family)
MRAVSPALATMLQSSPALLMADLYEVELVDATVLRYTTFDLNLSVGGNTYFAVGPIFQRSGVRYVIGTEVDTLNLSIRANDSYTVGGVPLIKALRSGTFDGAHLTLSRIFMTTPTDTSAGAVVLFTGRFSDIEVGRYSADVTVASDLELLNMKLPRSLYQQSCINTLYDAGCKLLKANFAATATIQTGSTQRVLKCALAQAAGHFNQGTVTMTSGPNNAVTRTIKAYTPGEIILSYPLPTLPSVGNSFVAYPGCDKLKPTCESAKFNNLPNFRGFPFIPVPETAL